MITVLPCMGLGQVLAQVVRAGSYIAKENYDQIQLVSLPELFSGNDTELEKIKGHPVILVDGCKEKCTCNISLFLGIEPNARIYTMDVLMETRNKPGRNRQRLEGSGLELANALGNRIIETAKDLEGRKPLTKKLKNLPENFENFKYTKCSSYYRPESAPDLENIEPSEDNSGREVCIFPCMGINKPAAQVSQMAAYKVNEEMKTVWSSLLCVPAFLAGVQEDLDMASDMPTIIIEGCEKKCASRIYSYKGLKPAAMVYIPDIEERTNLKADRDGITLNEDGWKLSEEVAKQVHEVALKLMNTDYPYEKQVIELFGFEHHPMAEEDMGLQKENTCWVPKCR